MRFRTARSSDINDFPGPGDYDARPPENARGMTISERYSKENAPDAGPGPGAYRPDTTQTERKAPAFSITSSRNHKTTRDSKEDTPGPQYVYEDKLRSRSAPAFSFPHAKPGLDTFSNADPSVPGPG